MRCKNSSPLKRITLWIVYKGLGPGLILRYEISKGKGAQDRDRWWALVYAVMYLQVP
jgi:hypothetical protein